MTRPWQSILMILVFMATMLLPATGQAQIIDADQQVAIEAEQGPQMPPGAWGMFLETVKLYPHWGELTPPEAGFQEGLPEVDPATGAPIDPVLPEDGGGWIDYAEGYDMPNEINANPSQGGPDYDSWEADPNNKRVRITARVTDVTVSPPPFLGQPPIEVVEEIRPEVPAIFTLPEDMAVTTPMRWYGLQMVVNASPCDSPNLDVRLHALHLRDGEWQRIDHGGPTATDPDNKIYKPLEELKLSAGRTTGSNGPNVYAVRNSDGNQEAKKLGSGNPSGGDGVLFPPKFHYPEGGGPGVPITGPVRLQVEMVPAPAGPKGAGETCLIRFDTKEYPAALEITGDSARISTWVENTAGQYVKGLPGAARSGSDQRKFSTVVVQATAWPDYYATQTELSPIYTGLNFYDLRILNSDQEVLWENDWTSGKESSPFQVGDVESKHLGDAVKQWTWPWSYAATVPDGDYYVEATRSMDESGSTSKFATDAGRAIAPVVSMGKTGVEMELQGSVDHKVNPGQQTVFPFVLRNIGADDDQILVSLSVPNNWEAELSATSFPLAGGGGTGQFKVTVSPPPGATSATNPGSFTVKAASSKFPDSVTIEPVTVTVGITDDPRSAVAVTSSRDVIDIAPGQKIENIGLVVRNDGYAEDIFTVTTSRPSFVQGWNVVVAPLSRTVLSGDTADFAMSVHAPINAENGDTFTLEVTAVRPGDASVQATINITVKVRIVIDVNLDVVPGVVEMRSKGADYCPSADSPGTIPGAGPVGSTPIPTPGTIGCAVDDEINEDEDLGADTSYDATSIFRLRVTNSGSQEDTYDVKGDFPGSDCNWLYRFGTANEITNDDPKNMAAAADFTQQRTLAAGEVVDLYWQVAVNTNKACPADEGYHLDVEVKSRTEGSVKEAVRLELNRVAPGAPTGSNDYPFAVFGVAAEVDDLREPSASLFVKEAGTAHHYFRVRNTGNQLDDLIISINDGTEHEGWFRNLTVVDQVHQKIDCVRSNDDASLHCDAVGVFDEVMVRLNVTPGSGVRLGERHQVTVTVRSGEDGLKSDSLLFKERLVGTYHADLSVLQGTRNAAPGQSVGLPFVLENIGTAGDTFDFSVTGPATWKPKFSMGPSSFVPGGSDLIGFVAVQVPVDAAPGTSQTFTTFIAGDNGQGPFSPVFRVNVVAPHTLGVSGVPDDTILMNKPGLKTDILTKAAFAEGTASGNVTFKANRQILPPGWVIGDGGPTSHQATGSLSGNPASATATLKVTAPEGAIGTSRALFNIDVNTTTRNGSGDLILDVADSFGVQAELLGEPAVIIPGRTVTYTVEVTNLGLSEDDILLHHTPVPTGWHLGLETDKVRLGPLESVELDITVTAPLGAVQRTAAALVLYVSSKSDPSQQAQVDLTTTVGYFNVELNQTTTPIPRAAPQEELRHVFTVVNNGTVADVIRASALLQTAGLTEKVTVAMQPEEIQLAPGRTADVVLVLTLADDVPSDIGLSAEVTFRSWEDPSEVPSNVKQTVTGKVLRYVTHDADEDGIMEYAIDRDGDTANGFEEFKESRTPGGRSAVLADTAQFLTDEARESFMVQVTDAEGNTSTVFRFYTDGDEDGRMDFLIDDSGNGLPDIYWDPDRGHSHRITVFKDVNADNLPDYFVDLNGDGLWDAVYDLASGTFIPVLQRDVDGDGKIDFIVDANRNGKVDADETVLYTRTGGLVTVQKVDVDGDGCKDDVFDVDGDGLPDHFIPCGSKTAIQVVLKDVTGDGVLDWTFDADGDGRRESYYNPAAQESSLIDTTGNFVDALVKYWYIGALFVLVLVLFVVLVAVTRR